jgi:ABC-type multidrug transport system fused ATPase/permease subunit
MSIFLQLWRLLDARQRRRLLLVETLAFLMAASTFAGIAAVIPFFAVLGDRGLITRNALLSWLYNAFGFTSQASFLTALGMGLLAAVLLANLINVAGSLVMNRFAYRIGDHFCVGLFDEYLHRGHQFHLAANSAKLFNNIVWEVKRGTTEMLQSYLLLTTNIATSALIICCMAIMHPAIGLTAIVALSGSYGAVYLLARRRLLHNGLLQSQHMAERTKIVNEAFGAIREIIVLNEQQFFRKKFAASCSAISRSGLNTQTIAQSPRHILDFIVAIALVAGALLSLGRGTSPGVWLPQLSFLGFAAYRLLPALQQIFQVSVKIRGDRVAFQRIVADLRKASAKRVPVRTAQAAAWGGRPHHEIELRDVDFCYVSDRPPAMRGVSLTIPAGATVGFVGPSGSGKTTLTELLLGLLTPTAGRIQVDGITLDEGNRGDWQSTLAYVPQHTFLFDSSLAENVALATELEQIDFERLREALRHAQLDEFVATLPRGDREMLGERGVRLSGGQRQRVGIARALYRRASLLVLDEPTSALDGLTESEIMATIETLRGRCTIILVAHRPSAVRRCDLIFELDGGAVVGTGTYGELMARSERFGRLLHGEDPRSLQFLRDYASVAGDHKE